MGHPATFQMMGKKAAREGKRKTEKDEDQRN